MKLTKLLGPVSSRNTYVLYFDEKFAQALMLVTRLVGGPQTSPRGSFDELSGLLASEGVEPLPETSIEILLTGIYFKDDEPKFSSTTAVGEREIVRHLQTGDTYVATKLTGDFWVLDPDLEDRYPLINTTEGMNNSCEPV